MTFSENFSLILNESIASFRLTLYIKKKNETELFEAITKTAKLTKVNTDRVIKAGVKVITKALKKGDAVRITGFGTFGVAKRAARKGHNPATGKEIKIPASKILNSKPVPC